MKKIKLITSLSTLGVLGGGVVLTTTSCSKNTQPEQTYSIQGQINWVTVPDQETVYVLQNQDGRIMSNVKWSIKEYSSTFTKDDIWIYNGSEYGLKNGIGVLWIGETDWTGTEKVSIAATINDQEVATQVINIKKTSHDYVAYPAPNYTVPITMKKGTVQEFDLYDGKNDITSYTTFSVSYVYGDANITKEDFKFNGNKLTVTKDLTNEAFILINAHITWPNGDIENFDGFYLVAPPDTTPLYVDVEGLGQENLYVGEPAFYNITATYKGSPVTLKNITFLNKAEYEEYATIETTGVDNTFYIYPIKNGSFNLTVLVTDTNNHSGSTAATKITIKPAASTFNRIKIVGQENPVELKEDMDLNELCTNNGKINVTLSDGSSTQEIAVNTIEYVNIGTCHLGEGITKINDNFLSDATSLKWIDIVGAMQIPQITEIGNNFLKGCTSFEQIVLIPLKDVTKIGSDFMSGCSALTSIDISVLSALASRSFETPAIGANFLYNCTSLETITTGNINVDAFTVDNNSFSILNATADYKGIDMTGNYSTFIKNAFYDLNNVSNLTRKWKENWWTDNRIKVKNGEEETEIRLNYAVNPNDCWLKSKEVSGATVNYYQFTTHDNQTTEEIDPSNITSVRIMATNNDDVSLTIGNNFLKDCVNVNALDVSGLKYITKILDFFMKNCAKNATADLKVNLSNCLSLRSIQYNFLDDSGVKELNVPYVNAQADVPTLIADYGWANNAKLQKIHCGNQARLNWYTMTQSWGKGCKSQGAAFTL